MGDHKDKAKSSDRRAADRRQKDVPVEVDRRKALGRRLAIDRRQISR